MHGLVTVIPNNSSYCKTWHRLIQRSRSTECWQFRRFHQLNKQTPGRPPIESKLIILLSHPSSFESEYWTPSVAFHSIQYCLLFWQKQTFDRGNNIATVVCCCWYHAKLSQCGTTLQNNRPMICNHVLSGSHTSTNVVYLPSKSKCEPCCMIQITSMIMIWRPTLALHSLPLIPIIIWLSWRIQVGTAEK